ncbi:MAG: nucleotidyltransferase domain-containing protein [Spirochaetia bacterium]|nr:nucleotidyltransferase domain-containing protein [Spirochaetia bacterium]
MKSKAEEVFGSNAKVYLFGSRAEDTKKGGDIDLFIDSSEKISLEKKFITR